MAFPSKVTLVEVGPRDGLQNELTQLSVADRVAMIHGLTKAGLSVIEAGSFVSPTWVPQMADSDQVYQALHKPDGIRFPMLVPNQKGLDRAMDLGVQDIAIFTAATDSFTQKNINCTVAESLDRFRPVVAHALNQGMRVRGYVSCVLGCPYEGKVDPARVRQVAKALYEMGVYEVSLGDTIGVGTPRQGQEMVSRVMADVPVSALAVHFHDTYGQALANIYATLELGVAVVDSSIGGLGGCPYAPGASGNVATEDVLYMLDGMGIETGVDLGELLTVTSFVGKLVGRALPSKVARAKLGA